MSDSAETIQWYNPEKSILPEEIAESFPKFLYLLWKHLGLPDPTTLQYDIADYLEDMGDQRQLIQAFRGCGKSWITGAFVLWCLSRNWDCKVLVVSAGQGRADNFSTFVLQVINSWDLLEPLRFHEGQLRTSKVAFDVGPAAKSADQAPSVLSLGITGQLAGSRAWLIVGDDVETPRNSLTVTLRERLSEAVKEFDAIIKPGGKIVFLGTPQCEDSVYTKIRTRGVNCRIWPARVPETVECYHGALAPMITQRYLDGDMWQTTEPIRFSDKDLDGREMAYGRSGFQLQFMLNTELSDADRFPLKLQDIPVMPFDLEEGPMKVLHNPSVADNRLKEVPSVGLGKDAWYRPVEISPDKAPYSYRVLAVDPSGRGKDETGVAVGLGLNSQIFIPYLTGLSGGYSENSLTQIAELAAKYKVHKVIVEANFGDGMFLELLRPYLTKIYPVTVEEVRVSQKKEHRIIDTLEPVLNQHRLIVDPKVIQDDLRASPEGVSQDSKQNYMAFYQLTRVSKTGDSLRKDDRVDALALLVQHFKDSLGMDRDKSIKLRQDRAFKDLFTGKHWGIFGPSPKTENSREYQWNSKRQR
jgi:hypothetical protein